MKRKLTQQMRNEWRNNLWMIIELIIVGGVLWAVFSIFAMQIRLHTNPKDVDFNDIYVCYTGYIPKGSSTHIEYTDSLHSAYTDLDNLIANLESNPYVESIGAGDNAIPSNYNYLGTSYDVNDDETGEKHTYSGNIRRMSPAMVRTLRITGVKGETPEQLADMIEEGKIIISKFNKQYFDNDDPDKFIGKQALKGQDSTIVVTVGALIEGYSRTDYEPLGGMIISKLTDFPSELAIRVKPGTGRKFLDSLTADDMEFGNVYIKCTRPIDDIREVAHREMSTLTRNMSACAVFVLVTVFLGFLGSFWYRTQQRVLEVALRKVAGATSTGIFRRFISEGLMLLGFATPFIAILIFWAMRLFKDTEVLYICPQWLLWAVAAMTIAVMAVMIALGIWAPAVKAMKINPAEALKDQ